MNFFFAEVHCFRPTPVRTFLERFENRAEPTSNHGSQSEASGSAITNAVNVAGIPITNSVSGAQSASTNGAFAGDFNEHFNLGGFGLDTGLSSDKVGTGIGINQKPGQYGFHVGGFNFGLTNQGGLFGNSQQAANTQSSASASASGAGSTSTSQSHTQSNNFNLGNLLNVQNTLSNSQAHSSSQHGSTNANAEGGSASQISNANSFPTSQNFNPQYQQPDFVNNFQNCLTNPFSPANSNTHQHFNHYPDQPFPHNRYYRHDGPNNQRHHHYGRHNDFRDNQQFPFDPQFPPFPQYPQFPQFPHPHPNPNHLYPCNNPGLLKN